MNERRYIHLTDIVGSDIHRFQTILTNDTFFMDSTLLDDMRLGTVPLMFLIILLSIFGPLSTDMYLSGLPQMVQDFGTDEATMNMSLYMFMLVLSFSILFMGPISDKYGRRRILVLTMAIYVLSNLACCFVDNIWLFIILRMVQAFGGAGAMVSAFALIKDCFEGPERTRILSITATLGILGPMLSPVIGTVLINAYGWHSTFYAPALVGMICLVMGMMLPASLPAERLTGTVLHSIGRLGAVVKDKGFTMFMLMICIFTMSQLAYISVSSYIYQENFGLNTTEYSLALCGACILALILSNIVTRLRLSNMGVVRVVFALGLLSMFMMTFVAHLGWLWFMLSIVPCCSNTITARAFGFVILMNHHDGDNGSVSSVLNFNTFILAFFGMVIASNFPPDMFILAIAAVLLICCTVFAVMWYLLKRDGYPVKGLV